MNGSLTAGVDLVAGGEAHDSLRADTEGHLALGGRATR